MKIFSYLGLLALAVLLIYAAMGLPSKGDTKALANQEISLTGSQVASSYYIKRSYTDAHTPNIVTTIIADYRAFDTLGEEVVIFAAGIICYLLLRREKKSETRKH